MERPKDTQEDPRAGDTTQDEEKSEEELVDETSEDSFPASDPPSY